MEVNIESFEAIQIMCAWFLSSVPAPLIDFIYKSGDKVDCEGTNKEKMFVNRPVEKRF